LLRLRLDALWYRSAASVSIAPDVALGRGVRIIVSPGSRSVLRVGSGALVGDDVQIVLEGGQALIGKKVDIRRGSRLVVGGLLQLVGPNVLQAGCSIHCHERITIAPLAVLSEYLTVVDSVHHFTTPDEWVLDNVQTAPISIGYNVWVGAKATISRGVCIGEHSIVAANSLVTNDVPAGHLASGVPAKVVRPVKLPWLEE
jgi:acetyltransferase-like isoleucine patch superfamily enzyme